MILIAGFICGTEIFTVKSNANKYTEELNQVSLLMSEERFDEASELSRDILKSWTISAKHLDKYLYHDYIDDITEEMSSLPVNSKSKDKSAVRAQIEQIKIQLTSLKESELPYMHNIL